jgi:homoserine/homoserine lactone efflux protein
MTAENNIVAFVIAVLTISLIPGMNVLVVISQSMQHGLKRSLAGIAGVLTGNVIYCLIAFFGTNLILTKLPSVFIYVKIAGIAFLLYSATKLIIAGIKFTPSPEEKVPVKESTASLFVQGFITHMANPKAFIFWITVLPGFLVNTDNVTRELFQLSALAIGLDTMVLLSYSSVANYSLRYMSNRSQKVQLLFSGFILVAVAVWLYFI